MPELDSTEATLMAMLCPDTDEGYSVLLRCANIIANHTPNPGRNEPCPCGSGKKYKKCHAPLDEAGVAGAEFMSSDEEIIP